MVVTNEAFLQLEALISNLFYSKFLIKKQQHLYNKDVIEAFIRVISKKE